MPYVYKLTHKNTGQYYFGFRSANKTKPQDDLWVKYFSSSKTVKQLGYDNFVPEILMEFENAEDAFVFETTLIEKHISDPLNINKAIKGALFPSRKFTTLEHRLNLSKALKGKTRSPMAKKNCSDAIRAAVQKLSIQEKKQKYGPGGIKAQKTIAKMTQEERSQKFGWMRGKTLSKEAIEKIVNANTGRKHSNESRTKMSIAGKGRKQTAEHIASRSSNFGGGGNPRAIPVVVNGTTYDCKKHARDALGWSKGKLNEYLSRFCI